MMISFELNQTVGRRQPEDFWRGILRNVEKTLKIKKSGLISLALVGEAAMKKMNRVYRRKNAVTDVLSFAEQDVQGGKIKPAVAGYWGEIIICYSQAVKQAKKNQRTVKQELAWLLVHGVLHLLGYDHQDPVGDRQMRALEEKILG